MTCDKPKKSEGEQGDGNKNEKETESKLPTNLPRKYYLLQIHVSWNSFEDQKTTIMFSVNFLDEIKQFIHISIYESSIYQKFTLNIF